MYPDPMSQLRHLIQKYTIFPVVPDIARFRRTPGTGNGMCAFIGCTEPVRWQDPRGEYFLCEGHYEVMAGWITEVNRALISGSTSVLFRDPD